MTTIRNEDIKALRVETGVGIMDCKRALIEANGDFSRAKKILREPRPWSQPLARLVLAAVARARRREEGAVKNLETAVDGFDAREMALYSAAAKRRLGELLGGQRGEELIATGTEFMTQQGIVRPDRMTRMLAPGFD